MAVEMDLISSSRETPFLPPHGITLCCCCCCCAAVLDGDKVEYIAGLPFPVLSCQLSVTDAWAMREFVWDVLWAMGKRFVTVSGYGLALVPPSASGIDYDAKHDEEGKASTDCGAHDQP